MGKDDKLIDYIKSGKGLPPRKESSKYQTEKRSQESGIRMEYFSKQTKAKNEGNKGK